MHHSHLFNGRISSKREREINRAIEHLSASIIVYREPGSRGRAGWRGWISSPSEGAPFDKRQEHEITEALKAEGLWPIC